MVQQLKELDYPEGSILFDVRYSRSPETFEVIYWSPITQQLEVQYEQPIVDVWFLKEEYRTNKYQISQAEIDKCYPVYCKVSEIPKAIAMNIGGEYADFFNKNSATMHRRELTKFMCECPWVFKADFSPDVYFRLRWLQKYGDQIDVSKVTYSFLDIECDVIDKTIDPKDVKDVTQPVNAVTLILPAQKICAVMVLGPRPKHKLHPKFHNLLLKQEVEYNWMINNQSEFKRMVKEDDDDFFDFNDEIKLIKTIFDYINKYRPMFCLSWNGKFDQNYLLHRIEYLGYDPKDFFIPEGFKTEQLYYHEDNSGQFSFKTSSDWFYTSTYTVYICQLRLFAMIRKSQQERRSYSLSSVGKDVAKIDKLTQTKSGTFRQFAYTDFIKFILYNVRDVVVQLAIELKSNDCQSLVGRSYMFATQYAKCFKETHIVRNIREFIFEDEGFVQANTLLIDPNIDPAFKGAFVAPPEHNKPTGLILNGKRLNLIMYGVLDADAASYYPSTKMGMNMDPMSLLYKCNINNEVFQNGMCNNTSFNQAYIWHDSKNRPHAEDMTGPLMNTYKNKNEFSLMSNWFNEPTVSEVFEYLDMQFGVNV